MLNDNNSKKNHLIYYFHARSTLKINMGHNTNVYICLAVCVCLYYIFVNIHIYLKFFWSLKELFTVYDKVFFNISTLQMLQRLNS